MRYKLKKLDGANLEHAWKKAEKYRDLNQPEEAESICRDILDVSPEHQAALRTLGLALTDRFPGHWRELHHEALGVFAKLGSEYERIYYAGVAWERRAKAQLAERTGRAAYDAFVLALQLFERAQTLTEAPDPVLRYNRCVRAITMHPLLIAAANAPERPHLDVGDDPPSF